MAGTFGETRRWTYPETHPWLTFTLDLSKVDYGLWMDLGAIQSKIEHVANALLAPGIAQRLRTLYLAKGVHGTTAIEGNSLSEDEVRDRIDNRTVLPESQEYLGKAIDNVVDACNTIGMRVLDGDDTGLTPSRIQEFNKTVLDGLPVADHVVPGKTRHCSVVVASYRAPDWSECDHLLKRTCEFLNRDFQPPAKEMATAFAVLQAIVAHLYIVWIHPFGDGNGRTARLIEFQILLSGGVPTIAAHLLSNFYNLTREKYYHELAATSGTRGDVTRFLRYAVQGLRDQLDGQIRQIRQFQRDVVWRDYVHFKFRGTSGESARRRRAVALALPKMCEPVEASKLRHLTPEIAELYANRTPKTLARDIGELEKMELIVRKGKGVQANAAIVLQFLPRRRAGVNLRHDLNEGAQEVRDE